VTAERILAPTRSWGFVAAVTACFAATQAWLFHTGPLVHDEGLLTWLYSSYLSRDPVATLFFLKAKPPLAVLNLPGTMFGLAGFYVGHALIGCAGVVAMAAAARAASVREWGVATLLFACSPMYVVGTAAGFSNVDVAALTALALWLIFRTPRPGFGTALVLSVLPGVRFEAAVFVLVAATALLARDRNLRFLAGLVALPAVYVAAGAVWHRDALWIWHFPPTFAHLKETGVFGIAENEVARASPADLTFAITTVTPAVGLALIPARASPPWVRVGQLCTMLFLASVILLPLAGAAMGFSERYFLQILPVAALLVATWIDSDVRGFGVAASWAFASGLAIVLAGRALDDRATFALVAVAATLAFATIAWRRHTRLAAIGLVAFVVAWPLSGLPLDVHRSTGPGGEREAEVLAWLRAHSAERASRVVVTNLKLLDATLTFAKDAPPAEVHCLIQVDNEYELTQLTDAANGQRERVFSLARWRFYGRGVLAREFAAHPGPPGALVVLKKDSRLAPVDPDALAARGAVVLLRSPDLTILRLP
jgi:hypothetical protein